MYIFLIIIVCITIVEIYSIVNSGQNYKNKIKSNNVNIITENNDKLNRYSVFRDAKIKHGPGKITIKKDYNIFLLSNTNEIHIKKFETDLRKNNCLKDFQNCFDQIYYSSNMGMRKPDKNCFNKVLEDHNLKAQETLFIDDSAQHIEGAKSVGINAVLLKKEATILQLVPDIIQSKLH